MLVAAIALSAWWGLAGQGVDFAGFIFYPKSPRYVFRQMTLDQIRSIKIGRAHV